VDAAGIGNRHERAQMAQVHFADPCFASSMMI
jgi:hypothetical protein